MSAKPKPQSTEIDHIRDTLTDVVSLLGQTRQDVQLIKQQLNQQDKEIAAVRADNAEIKDMLKDLLSR